MKTVLIDADIIAFANCCAGEESVDWGEGSASQWENIPLIRSNIQEQISHIQARTQCPNLVLCFSHDTNFRYTVLPTYKHNRQDRVSPRSLTDIRRWMQEEYPWHMIPRLEADDVMGIMLTGGEGDVIASIDKDLLMIPGRHYNWRQDKFTRIKPWEGYRRFMMQVLTGDSTDGYSGIPKVGPKKAEAILADCRSPSQMTEAVVEAYMDRCLSMEYLLSQANVARILQAGMYNSKTGQINLWSI